MGLSLLEPPLCAHFPSQESSAPRFPHTAQNKCPGGLPGTAPRARSEASPTCCWLSSFVLPPPASWLESSSWPPASRTCCSGAAEGTGCSSASAAHQRGGAELLPALSSWRLGLFAQLLLAAGFVLPWDRAGGRRTGQGMAGGSSLLGEGSQGVLTSISSSKMTRTSSVRSLGWAGFLLFFKGWLSCCCLGSLPLQAPLP